MSQKLDNNVLELGKQKQFCPLEDISNFENLSIVLAKKSFIVHCMIKIVIKNNNMFLMFGINLAW